MHNTNFNQSAQSMPGVPYTPAPVIVPMFDENNAWLTQVPDYQNYYNCGYSVSGNKTCFNCNQMTDLTIQYGSFKFDHATRMHYYEKCTSKGKIKCEPIANNIQISSVKYINPEKDGTWEEIVVYYTVDGTSGCTIISYEDYCKNNLYKHFQWIRKATGCSYKMLNELLKNLILNALSVNVTLYKYQGWNVTLNGNLEFIARGLNDTVLSKLLSDSIKNRELYPAINNASDSFRNLNEQLNGQSYKAKSMVGLALSSVFQIFFEEYNVRPEQVLIAEYSDNTYEELLTALLKTSNYTSLVSTPLDSDDNRIKKELSETNDGVALFNDATCIDEESKIAKKVKILLNDLRHENNNTLTRHLIAIISKNIACTAHHILGDRACILSFDDVDINCNPEKLQRLIGELTTHIICCISSNQKAVREFFCITIDKIRREMPGDIHVRARSTYIFIIMMHYWMSSFWGCSIFASDDIFHIVEWLSETDDCSMNKEQVIQNEFAAIVNENIRKGVFGLVEKTKYTTFRTGSKTVIVMGDNICFEADIINNNIVPSMKTVRKRESLINALKAGEVLYATDNSTHPVDLFDPEGKHLRLYTYSVNRSILDYDVQQKIDNLENEAFFFDENPGKDFLPMLTDVKGRVAGKMLRYRDAENSHVYITGQSGYGKTHLMSQLMASCTMLNHRVVVFDSSDSFTYQALCRNLTEEFVNNHITFHNLDDDGIPVNLFDVDRSIGLPTLKKQLVGVLAAGIGKLSTSQTGSLRKTVSELLSMLNDNEPVRPQDILAMLDKGPSYESLNNRLEPLFEDIESCNMSCDTWGRFLDKSKDIVVIQTNNAFSENDVQIINMLLATLYNFQLENNIIPMDVFIDEIQNQDFSEQSPVCKILKEGRKIHMSFLGATQEYYPRKTEPGSAMSKADTHIFLKPTPDSANIVASELHYGKGAVSRFDAMERGDCIIKGKFFRKELDRNSPAVLSGKVCSFTETDNADLGKTSDHYYGNIH